MRFIYILSLLTILTNIIYFGVLYGLYKPAKSKYITLNCKKYNDTHSLTEFQCKPLLLNKPFDGNCVYDTTQHTFISNPVYWEVLLTVCGIFASIAIFIFIVTLIYLVGESRTT